MDKAWHVIHFLLTGHSRGGALPLSNAILADYDSDRSNDMIRFLNWIEVKEIAKALPSVEEFASKFDAEKLKTVRLYPLFFFKPEEIDWEAEKDYVVSYYEVLLDYYQEAAKRGNPMLVFMG